jgi:hypothetical protein
MRFLSPIRDLMFETVIKHYEKKSVAEKTHRNAIVNDIHRFQA